MLQRARAKRAEESGLEPQQSTISQEEKSGSTEQKFSSFEDGLNQTWSENASEKESCAAISVERSAGNISIIRLKVPLTSLV